MSICLHKHKGNAKNKCKYYSKLKFMMQQICWFTYDVIQCYVSCTGTHHIKNETFINMIISDKVNCFFKRFMKFF